ncbi:36.4 kDa proline-rich protein-like [Phragmites australis]|uniref:36.4 kDa proline-rich protein-like n=1 Tax=Phragmites australis TaxID=29695 RepID=UPI002D79A610|nr:36.4 kDa proline-rich protein-like [Phragmites australis]
MAAAKNHRIVPLLLVVAATLIAQLAPATACPYCPTPKPSPPPPSPPPPPPPTVKPPPTPVPCPPPPSTPTPSPPYTPSPTGKCPVNTLKLLACVDALNGLVHAVVGAKASEACCPLLSGVADLDAALCLCTAIKAKALSVSLVLPIAIEVLVNECDKHVPSSFQCP